MRKHTDWYSKRLARCYQNMVRRCKDRNNEYYGGRGIRVCEEWLNDPQAFNDWAVENGYQQKLTIDRIDNDGDYCPENCHWVTKSYNCARKRKTRLFKYGEYVMTLREWAKFMNLPKNYFVNMSRIYKGEMFDYYMVGAIEGFHPIFVRPPKKRKKKDA